MPFKHGIFASKTRIYLSAAVAVSEDPDFKGDVKLVFNHDAENLCGCGKGSDSKYFDTNFGKLIDAKGVKGRYVRLYSDGNDGNNLNHYVEVEVFGKTE